MARFKFMGQDINIGQCVGFPYGALAIEENASAFSILTYFQGDIADGATSGKAVLHTSDNRGIFAIAFYIGSDYGNCTYFKLAANGVNIDVSDNPPFRSFDPANDWWRVGTFDPDNITIGDIANNSISFYEQDSALFPYYASGTVYNTYNEMVGNYAANIFVAAGLSVLHSSPALYEYIGATPLTLTQGAISNYIDSDIDHVLYPSYQLSGKGFDNSYPYNPLVAVDVVKVDSFERDTSTPGGGGPSGYYGWEGGNIWFSSPLGLSAIDTGLLTLFSPDKTQTRALANYLWNDNSFFTQLQKLWTEPMDTIISFGILPCNLSSITDAQASTINVGNVNTGLTAFKLNKQYLEIDFKHVNIPQNSNNALDFEPFCKAQMYLPFVGFVPMKINEIMGANVYLKYQIDCLSGDCVAQVGVEKYNDYQANLKSILYEYHGNCLIKLPLCSRDFSSFYKNLITAPIGAISGAVGGSVGGGVVNGVASVVDTFLDGPDIQRSGAYSGSSSAFALRTPYIVVTKACQHMPEHYSKYVGYPSFITYTLSTLSGFTVVEGVIDNTVKASDSEKIEIENLLKEGVIL